MLATSNCKECSNLFNLLLIPFAMAGILLVALILVLNITIVTGHSWPHFYANIDFSKLIVIFIMVDC